MSSRTDPTPMPDETLVRIGHDRRGHWQVVIGDTVEPLPCATLDEARRLATRRLAALARTREHPFELVVRDAYDRVVERRRLPPARRSRGR